MQPNCYTILYFFDDFSSGIVIFVHSVPESEQGFLFLLYLHDKLADVLFCSNCLQHPNYCFICPSMFGTVEGSCCHSDCCVDINS